MSKPKIVAGLLSAYLPIAWGGISYGQATSAGSGPAYPVKPIRVVTAGIGGGNDVSARLMAQGLTAAFGQQSIVDNRASGIITAEAVAKAAPDGYTVLVYGSTIWTRRCCRPRRTTQWRILPRSQWSQVHRT